jgi:hypothetical protein
VLIRLRDAQWKRPECPIFESGFEEVAPWPLNLESAKGESCYKRRLFFPSLDGLHREHHASVGHHVPVGVTSRRFRVCWGRSSRDSRTARRAKVIGRPEGNALKVTLVIPPAEKMK